jgi:hypothetical protein
MISIAYPAPAFRIRQEGEKEFIFDSLRKKWLLLTSEEWVRQNFIQYLIQVKSYPSTLIALEKKIQLGELVKRFDILVYDRDMKPWMMIECKGSEIKLDDLVMEQLLRYNISVPVPYLVITNGNGCYGYCRKGGELVVLNELPELDDRFIEDR